MAARYRLDPGKSQFTVQAFAAGMLSALGHSPTFAVRDFAGVVRFEGEGVAGLGVDLTARADSLDLLDRVKPADRDEILLRMRREVLETAAFPEVAFHTAESSAERVDRGRYRVFLGGRLTLHGVTQPQGVDAELRLFDDGLQLLGGGPLRLSSFSIRPVTALAGAIKLKDDLKVSFDLIALPEGP
jgi:polyisoprenoid-binding protein YceI